VCAGVARVNSAVRRLIVSNDDKVMNLRELDWPKDRDSILALDTSYLADRRLSLDMTARCASLVEELLPMPVRRTYGFINIVDKLPEYPWVRVASDRVEVVGLAALSFEAWNRRARLEHLYVGKRSRGSGVGRMLIEAALQAAASLGARGVFVETQTTNYGAVRFYEQIGFRWCGLDSSLYDLEAVSDGEVGIFFWRDVP